MKFKSQNRSSQMPEVNLIPMMDVIMTILTFFIIVSMTLTNSTGSVKVQLPGSGQGSSPSSDKTVEPQVIKIDAQGKLYLIQGGMAEIPVTLEQVEPQVRSYLQQNAKGIVLINADRTLPYDNVIQVLMKLKAVGGDRVSLGVR
jgi:biopolymer transport protein ExbD